jgi:hypothetical protein
LDVRDRKRTHGGQQGRGGSGEAWGPSQEMKEGKTKRYMPNMELTPWRWGCCEEGWAGAADCCTTGCAAADVDADGDVEAAAAAARAWGDAALGAGAIGWVGSCWR